MPLPQGTNSLYVLATHAIGSEHGWIAEILGQAPPTRNRAAEFLARGENATALRAQFERTAKESEGILDQLSAQDLATTRTHEGYGTQTLRWIILHVIEHYAEHLGQMRLTRQLWENRSTSSSVDWSFQSSKF
jgi:uncharacterized damage-inducible protein DinB